ncbi:MAG: Xaa-Pro peptidase family protein [Conexivisphaerales archaeon]
MSNSSFFRSRRQKVLRETQRRGAEVCIVGTPQNLYYLTNFWGEAIAVIDDSGAHLVVPLLEKERAEESVVDTEIVEADRGVKMFDVISDLVKNKNVAVDDVSLSTYKTIASKLGKTPLAEQEIFFNVRMVKDESELSLISQGGKIMDRLYSLATEIVDTGISERKISAALVEQMIVDGADPPAYESTLNPLIVASGPNGALPHAYTTDREIKNGEFVILDLVLRYKGYVIDCTRTFAVGTISTEMKNTYNAVLKSQIEGVTLTDTKHTTGDVDTACRESLRKDGYAEYFVHGTGHGIGLDVHEPPWLRAGDKVALQEGMTVTVEPGVYFHSKFGVRIEDSVLVKERPQLLTTFSKELITL